MGNNQSSEKRPPLKPSASSSSTSTVRTQSNSNSSGKRRKSIELPDLDPSLLLTPTSSVSRSTDLLKSGKGKAVPPSHSGLHPVYKQASASSSYPGTPNHAQQNLPDDDIFLGGNTSDKPPALSPVASPDILETTQAKELPDALSDAIFRHLAHTTIDKNDSVSSSPIVSGLSASNVPAPLNPPFDTVVAPLIPNSLPLGTGASATTGLIIGSPLSSTPATPVASPSLANVTADQLGDLSISASLEAVHSPASAPTATHEDSISVPLPAAAPLVALTGNLANNPAAVEAVKAATVDLGAGPEGVPTLLTWTPGEGEGKEGGAAEGDAAPEKVYVTGTFAHDWTTKIELRRKKSQPDFTALVNLPPGPHRLKFIVDTQWKTSKNLPSATDQDGNLINYLQVSKSDVQPATSASVFESMTQEDEERYWREESQWTKEIPTELLVFGEQFEAEEAAISAHEAHNRKLQQDGLPPEPLPQTFLQSNSHGPPPVPPPTLPAQLQRGVLNFGGSQLSGPGDDNSILPKPDHSVLDHLAASPISKGLLSVGITKRYRRKFVSTVFYKPVPSSMIS